MTTTCSVLLSRTLIVGSVSTASRAIPVAVQIQALIGSAGQIGGGDTDRQHHTRPCVRRQQRAAASGISTQQPADDDHSAASR